MPNLLGNIALAGTLAQTLADAILAAITNAQIVAQLSKSLEELGESGQASIAVKVTASVDLDSLVPLATAYITLQGGLDIELGVSVLEAAGVVESVISGIVRNLSNEPIEGVDDHLPRGFGKPIIYYDPSSTGATSYRAMARELLEQGSVVT